MADIFLIALFYIIGFWKTLLLGHIVLVTFSDLLRVASETILQSVVSPTYIYGYILAGDLWWLYLLCLYNGAIILVGEVPGIKGFELTF